MRSILPADCARARQQLSLRVDSELSEFERVLLGAHLTRCDDCRAFEDGITGLTQALRTVPAEKPSISFQPPRRRAGLDAVLAGSLRAGSAAAAVAVVAISGLVALNGSSQAPTADLASVRAVLELHERQLQQLENVAETQRPRVARGLVEAETIAFHTPSSRRLEGRR
jgi:predicted anti-sigma-YlaC factor YlaD